MQVPVGEQIVLCRQLRNVVDHEDKLLLVIRKDDRHGCETSARFYRRDNRGPAIAASCDWCVRRHRSKPSRGRIVCDYAVECHHEMALDILRTFKSTVVLEIGSAGI